MNIQQPSIAETRSKEIFQLSRDSSTYEVTVDSDITLEDYRKITLEEDWKALEKYADQNKGKTVVFINPTMEGGGVAMLRPPLVHVLQMMGVDARWFVMEPYHSLEVNPFLFTKQMHNIMQRRTLGDERITEEGKAIHRDWNDDNAKVLTKQPAIMNADVIVIDDPQPAPLKKHIDKVNPSTKWVWRNHIDTDGELMSDASTPQGEIAHYIFEECGIRESDAIVNHPVEKFIYPELRDKTYLAPATIEPFDDLNRDLSEAEIKEGVEFINNEIKIKNIEFDQAGREEDIQELIDPDRRRITLIARFDESKGMDKAMELGVRTREKMVEEGANDDELPQIVIIGNGSVDDPSGIPMYEEMLQLRREQYPECKKDIIIMRVRHNYMAVNAIMYPREKDGSFDGSQLVALQTSEAEGCETRITDWLRHGVPVVISNRGGMKLQVIEGESGTILDYDKPDWDIDKGAEFIANLMVDKDAYEKMRESTLLASKQFNSREFTTISNTIRLLRVFSNISSGVRADKYWKISDIVNIK